ncbi:hypothetical protein GEMRC1_006906 [Eukaryota sp. GEM-RC1]
MSSFTISVSGQIRTGTVFSHDHLTLKYQWFFGSNWQYSGTLEGVSHTCTKSHYNDTDSSYATWAIPLSISFESSSVHGWPRLVFQIFGKDWLDREVHVGYGAIVLPLKPGSTIQTIPLFK